MAKEMIEFSPYTPTRAFEEIADQIKQVIFDRKLNHGDRLPSERALADQFRVGRLTIREALRTLETKGLIIIKKGSGGGSFVGGADPGAVASIIKDNFILEGLTSNQLTEARIAVECAAVKAAARHATEEDLARISTFILEAESFGKSDESGDILDRMIRFHSLIAEASHNIPFIIFNRALMEWALSRPILRSWVPSPEDLSYARESYTRIFSAIRDGDADGAQKYMREHIEHMGELIKRDKGGKEGRG